MALVTAMFSCQKHGAQEMESRDSTTFYFDWNAMTTLLVQQMNIQPGERILLVARPGRFDPLVLSLQEWIEERGGVFLGAISVDTSRVPTRWETEFSGTLQGTSHSGLVERLKTVDVAILLPGTSASDEVYAAMQEVLRGGQGRTIHFHWSGAYSLEGVPLEITPEMDRQYQTAILATDYGRLSMLQQFFAERARLSRVRVTTPQGTDISFSVGDRPITRQDGDASRSRTLNARNLIDREIEFPAGAVRVAPVEESVVGKIVFPATAWNGENVKDLVLTFEAGKVTHMTASAGLPAVQEELRSAGPAGYAFREFALGFNPWLTVPEIGPRWVPYYGYGAGVVRLSLGDNTELGGNIVGDYVRWNFFTDATVMLEDVVLVKDGKMLK
jgi:hypothetical protein